MESWTFHRPDSARCCRNRTAAIFWMKARAGWREKHPEEPAEEEKTTVVIYRSATDRYGNPVSQPFDLPSPVLSINKDGDGS